VLTTEGTRSWSRSRVSRDLSGTPTTVDSYTRGVRYLIDAGHLYVFDGTHRDAAAIAVYAPERWVSAEVEEQTAA
jgi:hypothetical protein